MKKASIFTIALALLAHHATAQLSGTKNIPGDYGSLNSAFIALNSQGVGAGGVTLNLLAGNPQTAPAGGYVIGGAGSLLLTSSSAANPVLIVGNGNIITADATHATGSSTDAIFKLVGADWVTLSGFTLRENPANTTLSSPANDMTEWAVALLHASTTDGAQNNTILSNNISLNRSYANSFGIYGNNRHSATAPSVIEDIVNSTTAPNSGNRIYGNIISNVNLGIALVGSSTAANMDVGNDIGGTAPTTGNTLANWGGAAPAAAYISVSAGSFGIFMNHQTADNVSFNTLTSATASGTTTPFRGIFKDYTVTSPTGTFISRINNNSITMSNGFFSGIFEAIRSQGMNPLPTATININSNSILNCAVTNATASISFVGIANSSAPGALTMNRNTVRGNTSRATTGGFTGIANSGAVVNTIDLNANRIGDATAGAITFALATSGTVIGIGNTGGAATCALSMQGNDIRGIVHAVNGSSVHYFLQNGAATFSQNISGNTLTALNLATSGSVTCIVNSVAVPAGGFKTVNSNAIVTSFTKSVAGGTLALYGDIGASEAGAIINNNDNDFSNISVTGATTIAGWGNADGISPTKTIRRNTFTNWTGGTSALTVLSLNSGTNSTTTVVSNQINNIKGGGAVTGIAFGTAIGTLTASHNRIHTLTSTGAAAVQGVTCAALTNHFFKNQIHDLATTNASGTVNALTVLTGSRLVNLYNNFIGNLHAPLTSSSADAIRGINITSTTTTSSINVHHNTIYFSASSSGANFSTSGLFHTTSTTATTATLDLRNNVIVNTSAPNGSGVTAAYRRSSGAAGTLANYASTANNNNFYAGTPVAPNFIYYDGTSYALTLTDYKSGAFTSGTISPRDGLSVTENPNFISTAGSSASFLHIEPSIPTPLEGGGAPIAGVTDDFDGDSRSVSLPDIGADEFAGTHLNTIPPAISYTPLGRALPSTSRALPGFATITDSSGTVSGGGNAPRIYYKKSTDADIFGGPNNSSANGWKYVVTSSGSSPYSFTINYSLLTGGGVSVGDVIEYFVVAQNPDNLLASNPTEASASGNPPVPNIHGHGPLNSYLIAQAFAGTKSVGPGVADYTTLTAVGGIFDAINNGIVTNNLLILITGDLVFESGDVPLNQTTELGAGNYTITIRPAGGPWTITGSATASLIRLHDADRVTIDGSTNGATAPPGIGGSAALRGLTINNFNIINSTAGLTASGVANGAQNNTFKNLNIVGYDAVISKVGISIGGETPGTVGVSNQNNRIENCSVRGFINGIYSAGSSAAVPATGLVITRNDLSATGANRVSRVGIFVSNDDSAQITENSIGGIEDTTTLDSFGITLGTTAVTTTTITGGGVINANVSRNKINGVSQLGTSSAVGIAVAGGAGVNTIANNMISGVIADANASDLVAGILVLGATGSTNRLYYNSVSMTGNRGITVSQYPSYALAITGTDPVVELKDNLFYNIQDPASGGTNAKSYAIGMASATFGNLSSDYNGFYSAGPLPGYFRSGSLNGGAGIDYTNLVAWRTATARDAGSFEADPLFASASDLHIISSSPAFHTGVSIPGISVDIDGDIRTGLPSIGADELPGAPVAFPFKVTGVTRLGNGALKFGFTNISGMSFTAFGCTNVSAPFNTWSNLGPAVETPPGSGQYQFTDLQATNNSQRFYRVRSP